ncbi:hypothetical protein [Pseudomonas sp. W2-17]|uniref:hypothetical protein n=1 Tax=Pseudomonas sp. W2-17 TaxID=3058039 RepID=UPI0034E08DF8
MKRLFANKWIVTGIAFLSFAVGAWASDHCHQSMWLARSGAVAVAMGIFLMANAQLNGVDIQDVWDESSRFRVDDPRHYQERKEAVPNWVKQHSSARFAVEVLGPVVTLTGTVIWGFGDLIPF